MTDEFIMETVKNGDLEQASVLFERYQKPIFNYLARMAMDRNTAEDLTQNVFLRVIRYRNSFRDGHKFQSWIYQIARNVFSDHYRKRQRVQRSDFARVENIQDQLPDDCDDNDQSERERILHMSLQRLSHDDRELLLLTRYQRMQYEEVAEILNTSVGNIKIRVHRAIQKLREYYFELEKI